VSRLTPCRGQMPTIVIIAKRMRASPLLNGAGRRVLRTLLEWGRFAEDIAERWRVRGTPTVTLQGTRFRMLGQEDDNVLDALYYRRGWESGETRLFATLAHDAAVVLDLGANSGVYSLLATRISTTVRVVAVEPSPVNAARLRRNLELNGERRVTVIEAAVGASDGTLELTIPADGSISDVASGIDAFSRAHYDIDYTRVSVAQMTVDRLVDDCGLDRVDLIKIDVEYLELEVLKGATRTLTDFGPVVLAEVLDYDVFTGDRPELRGQLAADKSEKIEALMASHDYGCFAVGERGLLRVETLRGIPDGGSNYAFVKHPPDRRYIPYTDAPTIGGLLGRGAQR
jgi:FkbM family methyltransferase